MSEIDSSAFREIYDVYWHKVYKYASRILADSELAQDVVQQVFVSLWERRAHLDLNNVEAYLIRAIKFACLATLRKQQKQRSLDEKDYLWSASSHATDEYSLGKDLARHLNKILATLSKDEEYIFRMRFEDGLDNRTIAANLMLSEKTIRNKLCTTLGFVRRKLKSYGLKD
ncbi:RNA polymerase sigma factor [Sphingobacterium corticibacter]|uniref:Sigma-70 family RNA polymerase sigma factor n=1 Tax=Sphingobacterium corticibacter TaxID=2171749 RepID=A0A2T8HFQ0_9SPHI|nr:sigma-70 family RNA polymerase sigma factor [Sphingobacterium corticibacter]PVH24269.1 hypothetical protein DC487_14380 [Sphingobacterium corticibacter]